MNYIIEEICNIHDEIIDIVSAREEFSKKSERMHKIQSLFVEIIDEIIKIKGELENEIQY